MASVVLLVILRMSIGCHFFYEGVWKIKNQDKFSARPFLTQAKGPVAPLFYAMVSDLDGRERLKIETNEKGDRHITGEAYLSVWRDLRNRYSDYYKLSDDQKTKVDKIHKEYEHGLRTYLADNLDDIAAHFGSLDRFEEARAAGTNGAAYFEKRMWDEQMKLRKEAGEWLSELEKIGNNYKGSLFAVLDESQRAKGQIAMPVDATDALPIPLPFICSRSGLVDFAVTYGLTAIGFCLLVGLCTRLACLGGGVFLIFVLLTQPPWPPIYPHAPAVVGHALIVDKNFVEMVAVFMLATTTVGRWGGLDFFLYHWIGRPILKKMNLVPCAAENKDKNK